MALIVSPNQLRDPVNNPGDFWNAVNGYLNAPAYFPPESVSLTAASVTLVRLDFDRTISLATDYVVDPDTGTLSNAVSFGRIWIVQRGYVQTGSASGNEISRVVAATTSADPDVAGRDAADGASLVIYNIDASALTTGTIRETIPNNGIDPDDTSPTIVRTTTWYGDYVLLVEASPVAGAGDDARFLISEDNAAAERSLGSVWGAWLDGTAPFTPPTQTFGVYDAPVGWTVDENIYGDVFGIDGGVTIADGVISEDAALVRQKLAYALREVGATSLENLLVDRGLSEAESQAWRESIEADPAIVDALAHVSYAVIDTAVALVVALTDGVTPQETIDQLMQQIVVDHAAASAAAEAAVAARLADPAFDGNAIPAGMTDAGLRSLIVRELLQATLRLMAYDGLAEYLHINVNPGYFANGRWDPSDLGRDAHGLVIGGAIGDDISGSGGVDLLIGGAGDDGLSGGGGDDRLAGGAGADRLDGGAGSDTASYADATSGVHVDLLSGRGALAEAEGDTLTGIENLNGSAFDDLLEGDTGVNQLRGGVGDDVLRGRGGADRLDGGAGSDTVSYTDAAVAIRVDLAAGTGTLGDAAGDVLISIENVNGSASGDTIEGNAGANRLQGFNGDDVLRGRGGADRLDGGAGADVFVFDAVTDSRLGASDQISDFNRAQGDRIDLSAIDVAGDRGFTFIGDGTYSGVAGELRVAADSGALIVYADVDGDRRSDMSILVYGVTSLTSADFIL
jgi:Ca2+-binding RTX toxin-like protein